MKKYILKKDAIVVGDHIGDSNMIKNCIVSIGIANKMNYAKLKQYFDYVFIGEE